MSFLNSRRDVLHGVGGGNVSLNNVPFSKGKAAGFLSDDECFFANGGAAWVAYIHSLTGERDRPAVASSSDSQFGQSFNTGYAGGGVWAAWLGSDDSHKGLYASTGLRLPDAGLLGVGPDGVIGFKPLYQSAGPSYAIDAAGEITKLTDGTAYDLQLLGGGCAIWQEGNRLRALGFDTPRQVGNAWKPMAYLIAGRWWVSYFSDVAGIVLHPADDATRGIIVVPPGLSRWQSSRAFGSEVVFALAISEAEQAGEMLPLVSVDTRLAPLVPLQPQVVLPKPARPLFVGCFEFAQAPHGPGNALLQVRGFSGALEKPAILGAEELGKASGAFLGLFISGSAVADIEAAAGASTLRPVAYWDARRWPRWPELPAGSWLCVRAYCAAGESAAAFKADMAAVLASAPAGVPLVLVGQQYSSNAELAGYIDPATPAPQDSSALLPLAQVLIELANETPEVIALLLFSGFGRAGGLCDHPDLLALWQEWLLQVVAPDIEPWPPAARPPAPPHVEPRPPAPRPSVFHALRKGVSVMRGFVKIHTDAAHYTGVAPTAEAGKSGDAAWPVYFARPGQPDAGGAWEEVEATPHDNGAYDVLYVAANRQASMQRDGSLQSRGAGTFGPFEMFQIRTEDVTNRVILYRDDLTGAVLEFEPKA